MKWVWLITAVALGALNSSPSDVVPAAHTPMTRDRPLSFEANRGQAGARVDFVSRGSGYTLLLSPSEATFALRGSPEPVRMRLVGANDDAQAVATERLPGKVHYFIGNDAARWRTNIPTFAKATYRDVYRGIDVVYYGNQHHLEYDFIVRPDSRVETIALHFEGADRIELDAAGELLLHTGDGVIRNGKPHVYQVVDGRRQTVAGAYVLRDASQVGFEVGRYDTNHPLVIDPTPPPIWVVRVATGRTVWRSTARATRT